MNWEKHPSISPSLFSKCENLIGLWVRLRALLDKNRSAGFQVNYIFDQPHHLILHIMMCVKCSITFKLNIVRMKLLRRFLGCWEWASGLNFKLRTNSHTSDKDNFYSFTLYSLELNWLCQKVIHMETDTWHIQYSTYSFQNHIV